MVSGKNVINSYLNIDDDCSFECDDNDKIWYKTGDSGYLDDEGYLFVTGRIKEQYKLSNGKFVNPNDVEHILLSISEINQVMVYGNGDEYNSAIIITNLTKKQIIKKIDKIKHKFISYEFPKKFIITNEPFTIENDLLTQKQSLKRKNILKHFNL